MGMGDPRDYEWKITLSRKCDECYGSGRLFIQDKKVNCSCKSGVITREFTLNEFIGLLKERGFGYLSEGVEI